MWQAMVLLPKVKKEYRGIGLVEKMWKVVAAILNRRLTASVIFHGFLHRFWAGRGTGTATHRWELPGNYPVFTVVMVIYHYIDRIWRILVTPIFLYIIYDH